MQTQPDISVRTPSLTDVEGILVGHYTFADRPTGCTVILSTRPLVAGVDVRGGAPGTHETDSLRPENLVDKIDAVFLAGGSAFGLHVAAGVSRFLEEHGRGYATGVLNVPIVCGAILFDLALGDPRIRPDANAGYEAARSATADPVCEGNIGAGAGATVGKLFGPHLAMKGGLGSWAVRRSDGLEVGALVAVNAAGDVVDSQGRIVAGARRPDGSGFINTMDSLRKGGLPSMPFQDNTVIGVVATNALLSKAECTKVAQMAHDAIARRVNPSHTPSDGDAVFVVATGRWVQGGKSPAVGLVGALGADVLESAILRGVQQAKSWGPYPAARDYLPTAINSH